MKRLGLIGRTLGHSFSASYFAEKFEREGLTAEYEYSLYELPEIAFVEEFMRSTENLLGFNVTIPYKETVIPYLHCIDEKAKLIGSVNTIVNKFDMLYGYNTDYYGLKALIEKHEIKIENKKILILGTGGTSKTAFILSKDLGCSQVNTVSRTKKEMAIRTNSIVGRRRHYFYSK